MDYEDLIDWAIETDASYPDIEDALEHYGYDNSYEKMCEFLERVQDNEHEREVAADAYYNAI